jgi:hypothetical protein
MSSLVLKPVVGPWFERFIPAHWRRRSNALKEPAEALVLVFSGSTSELVRFLNYALDGVNRAFIALLPKKADVLMADGFRPISLHDAS